MVIKISIPYRLEEENRKGHWGAYHTRHKKALNLLNAMLYISKKSYDLPVCIEVSREGPEIIEENLFIQEFERFKKPLMDWLKTSDSSEITWKYSQRKNRQWCVNIKITPIIDLSKFQCPEAQYNAKRPKRERRSSTLTIQP